MVWVWIWKISPQNFKFFNFFPFRAGQRRVGLLFTAGQKYAQVGSGQGSSLIKSRFSMITMQNFFVLFCHLMMKKISKAQK